MISGFLKDTSWVHDCYSSTRIALALNKPLNKETAILAFKRMLLISKHFLKIYNASSNYKILGYIISKIISVYKQDINCDHMTCLGK